MLMFATLPLLLLPAAVAVTTAPSTVLRSTTVPTTTTPASATTTGTAAATIVSGSAVTSASSSTSSAPDYMATYPANFNNTPGIEFTFPRAGNYLGVHLASTPVRVNTPTGIRNMSYEEIPGWMSVITWPADRKREGFHIEMCNQEKCSRKGGIGGRRGTENPWKPTNEDRQTKQWKDWPADTYFMCMAAHNCGYGPLIFDPVPGPDYYLRMVSWDLPPKILAVSDKFELKYTNESDPSQPKILARTPDSGAKGIRIPAAVVAVSFVMALAAF